MSKPKKNLLDLYLAKVFENFIALKDNEMKLAQEVFKSVFEQVKEKMGNNCSYYQRYSSQVMYAGSVYDGIKVSKLDEFDMDVVIRLPISYEDGENGITIENEEPGFVKMKIDKAFDNLPRQPNWENCHRVTLDWRDSEKYFLQNKFRYWIQGVVQKAVDDLGSKVTVNGVTYGLKYTQSGPAFTLKLRNEPEEPPFVLDVDLVPVIKFMHPRWPQGYREPNAGNDLKDWLVVPKPNKAIKDMKLQNRCWRLSFQDFEKEMMKGCQNLKTTIRLVKKLRDGLKMKPIASYYIKTLFLWKISDNPSKKYWETKLSVLFKTMVQELHDAIQNKNIRYFWNSEHNLIGGLKDSHRDEFVGKLKKVLDGIEKNDMDKVISALLTEDEFTQFKKLDFYQKQSNAVTNKPTPKAADNRELVIALMNKVDVIMKQMEYLSGEMKKLHPENALKAEFLSIASNVDEISEEIEDMGFDEYNPKRIKKMDGSKASPKFEQNTAGGSS